jgi:hypothetical protein
MEARDVPALLATGIPLAAYNGVTDSTVTVVNAATNAPILPTIDPFPGYKGALDVASGDFNGDNVPDLVVAAQGAGGLVAVVDGASGSVLGSAQLFPGFKGQVSVGTADLSGNGYADILLAASAPNIPVMAIDLPHHAVVSSFDAAPGFSGPVSVSSTNLAGTGTDQILVGLSAPGLGSAVGVFSPSGALLTGVLASPVYLPGGISVAGGDVNGDGFGDIVVGAGAGAPGGEVKVFSGKDLSLADDFLPFAPTVTNGVNVYVADGTGAGQPDIFVTLKGGIPILAGFDGRTGLLLAQGGGGDGTNSGDSNVSGGDTSNCYYYDNGFASSNYTPPSTPISSGDTSGDTSDTSSSDSGIDCSGGDTSGDTSSSDSSSSDTSSDPSDPNS